MNPTRAYNKPSLKRNRRELRTNGTPAEAALWRMLKGKAVEGLTFRRQFSVGDHILDFYCPALRLAIELDGNVHANGVTAERDFIRDEDLRKRYRIEIFRFENRMVFEHPQQILNSIKAYAENKKNV